MDVDDNDPSRKRARDEGDDGDSNPNKRARTDAPESPSSDDSSVGALLKLLSKIDSRLHDSATDPDVRMKVFIGFTQLEKTLEAIEEAVLQQLGEQSGWNATNIAELGGPCRPFVEAATEGNLPQLQAMLEAWPPLATERYAERRATALKCAVRSGHVDVVAWLLSMKLANPWIESGLPDAAAACHAVVAMRTQMLELLMTAFPAVTDPAALKARAQAIRLHAIQSAIMHGLHEMLVILLRPEFQDGALDHSRLREWLQLAVFHGHVNVIETLLQRTASLDAEASLDLAFVEATRRKRTALMKRLLDNLFGTELANFFDTKPALVDACELNNAVAIEVFTSDEFKGYFDPLLVGIAKSHGTFNHIEAAWTATQDQLLDLVQAKSPGPLHGITPDASNAATIVEKIVECCSIASMPMSHGALCKLGMRALLAKALLARVDNFRRTRTLFGETPTAKQKLMFVSSAFRWFNPLKGRACAIDFDSAYADAGLAITAVQRQQERARTQAAAIGKACRTVRNSTLGEPLKDLATLCLTHGATPGALTAHLRTCGFSDPTAALVEKCWAASGHQMQIFCDMVLAEAETTVNDMTDESCRDFRIMELAVLQQAAVHLRTSLESSSAASSSSSSASTRDMSG